MTAAQKPKNHFVDRKELLEAVEASQTLGRVTDRLARMLMLMVDRRLTVARWSGYSNHWKDEMRQEALAQLLHAAMKFDADKARAAGKAPNPFSYFTTTIDRAIGHARKKEWLQRDIVATLMGEEEPT